MGNEIAVSIAVDGGPQDLDVGAGAVCVQTLLPLDEGGLVRIDPRTNEVSARVPVPAEVSEVAVGEGGVWAVAGGGGEGAVVRVDPAGNRVMASLELANLEFWNDLEVGEGSVWVASRTPSPNGVSILRIGPDSMAVEGQPVPVGAGAFSLAVGEGAVWAWTGVGNEVVRIDAEDRRVTESISVRARGRMAVGFGAVWVTGAEELIRIAL